LRGLTVHPKWNQPATSSTAVVAVSATVSANSEVASAAAELNWVTPAVTVESRAGKNVFSRMLDSPAPH
jgi:hypothetical protein